PSRALLDPAAYLDAPKNSRRANEEKINYNNRGLTGPAPSGMTYRQSGLVSCGDGERRGTIVGGNPSPVHGHLIRSWNAEGHMLGFVGFLAWRGHENGRDRQRWTAVGGQERGRRFTFARPGAPLVAGALQWRKARIGRGDDP
ncbi:hypothetical protein, partial [Pseudonocardia nigra]|uniref:hypothetical protein n=1 Tax=Pseudonocardia nigra TaxID=1921578 RepID=UPI001C5F2578